MHNRWYHTPKLHSPAPGQEKPVGWLELFYDLIYVAAIIQLGNALSHHVGFTGFLAFAALFVPLWLAWTTFTFYSNRFEVDDFTHRVTVFANMFGVGAMAISVPLVLDGHPRAFALSYVATRITLMLLYYRSHRQVPESREFTGKSIRIFSLDVIAWTAAAFLPNPWSYIAMATGVVLMLVLPLTRSYQDINGRLPPDLLHMSERYGLLTIIVLGESFVKSLSELAAQGATSETLLMGSMVLLITCSLWWIYFDDVAGSRIRSKSQLSSFVWVYTHLPLTLGVTATGVAAKKAIFFDIAEVAPAKYRWLLCGSLALVFLSVGIIDSVTERRQAELSDKLRVRARIVSAGAVLLLAGAGGALSGGWFLGLVTAFCVAQVLFDMMMAPFAEAHEHDHDAPAHVHSAPPGHAHAHADGAGDSDAPKPFRLRDMSDMVRKGAPEELRRDLYFYFMEGTWKRLFATFTISYLLANILFACLYMLDPSSVAGLDSASFIDAFAFSVQTMSTIGYGVMAPVTVYGHALVTIQAVCGLLGVAVATGLIFAKASRPTSSVLFSESVLVTRHHGVPSIVFRVGNARGNEVVEATMTVTVLQEEVTPEGASFRRLRTLKLQRSTTPLFNISWTVIHQIDADSPLYGVDWREPGQHMMALICTMLGHDATYGQTTHARHIYHPDEFVTGQRFIDVIDMLEDGRMQVDFNLFHNTEDDPHADIVGAVKDLESS